MVEAKKHPLDFDTLKKGMWLEAEQLEEATLTKRSDPEHWRKVLKLIEDIAENCGIVCRQEDGRVRLMTDSEAQIWNLGQAKDGARKIRRAEFRAREMIDPACLSAPEQAVHEHSIRVLGEITRSQRSVMRKNAKLFALAGPRLTSDAGMQGEEG